MRELDFEERFLLGGGDSVVAAHSSARKQYAYDGASGRSTELALYQPSLRSADRDILPAKGRVDARTRDTMNNDAYIQGASQLQRDTIVGSSYMLNMRPNSLLIFGKEDPKWEDEYAEEVEGHFQIWAESPDNWPDAARVNTFTQLVRLAVGIHVAGGEVLSTMEWRRDQEGQRPYNTAVSMVDTDRLQTPPSQFNNKRVKGGVYKDAFGAPLGYFIRQAHPSDYLDPDSWQFKYSPIRLPWGRLQVIHIFEQQRPDQTRGMAAMAAALKETKMAKQYRDIVIQNAVVNATYAASIESELPTEAIFARLGAGAGIDQEAVADSLNAYMGGYMSEIASYMGGSKNLTIDGVKVPHLPPGAKLQLRPAGSGSPLGNDFESSIMRYLAAALGTSYEELSRDFSKTNYSGFKGAISISQRGTNARKKSIADRFANCVFRCWFEEAFNKKTFTTLQRRGKYRVPDSLYAGQTLDMLTQNQWIGASFGQIDEMKETQAAVLRINAGLSTLADEAARLGKDWRQLMRQLARERDWKDFYKILQNTPDSETMIKAAEGATNSQENKTNSNDGES